MITLIAFAFTLVLLASAAWIAVHAYDRFVIARMRQGDWIDAEEISTDGVPTGVVIQFPHPPGVA